MPLSSLRALRRALFPSFVLCAVALVAFVPQLARSQSGAPAARAAAEPTGRLAKKPARLPDLRVTKATARTDGLQIRGTATVENAGRVKAKASRAAVAWHVKGGRSWGQLGTVKVGSLAAGGRWSGRLTVAVPGSAKKGRYDVRVCADALSQVQESSNQNNCRAAGTVSLAGDEDDDATIPEDGGGPVTGAGDTVPQTRLDAAPTGLVASRTATFVFSSNEGRAKFECALDGGAWAACASPQSYSALSDGAHAFAVRARNAVNVDPTPATATWAVDGTAPDTTIASAPQGLTNATSAALTLNASEARSVFSCRADVGPWAPCSTPWLLSGLGDGPHSVDVRATDAVGNTDDSPAHAAWTVDATPPHTTVTAAPHGTTRDRTADVTFSVSEAAQTECRLDAGAFATCSSPHHVDGLADGPHVLTVRATDAAGNVEPTPASAAWTVDGTAPQTTISGAPAGPTRATTAHLTLGAGEAGSTMECRIDGGAWAPCTSPLDLSGLSEGTHTVDVRATDAVGNVDDTPASASWKVDLTPPDTTITQGPGATEPAGPVDVAFTATEPDSTFECRVDSGSYGACTSPFHVSAPSVGTHTVQVRATDAAGNADATPAQRTWQTVATPAPAAPGGLTADPRDHAVRIGWNAVTGATQYRVYQATAQNGPWTLAGSVGAPTTTHLVDGLTNGVTYWFAVTALDGAGRESARSQSLSAKPENTAGISHCGPLTADATWAAGTHALTCTVTVPYGKTLTIAPGAIVKAASATQLVVQGRLVADGTAAASVTFTGIRDDTVGGDYNGDGADSKPTPGDWYGISTSGSADQPPSVTLDHVTLRDAVLSAQSGGDDRDDASFVARTFSVTDSRFEHGAALYAQVTGDAVVTGNVVSATSDEVATFPYGDAIHVEQRGYLSSVDVSRNTVTRASRYGVEVEMSSGSTVSPVVEDNAVSGTALEPVAVSSQRLDVASLGGNTSTNTLRRGLLLSGRLIADMTLPFGALPLVIGGSGLVVGDGVTLAIGPGVVVRSDRGALYAQGGTLKALGTAQAPIVFTTVADDAAGGDYDGDPSAPVPGAWYGISAGDGVVHPASVSLDHVDVRYAGVSIVNQGDDRDDPNYLPRATSVTNTKLSHGAQLSVTAAGPIVVTDNTVTNSGSAELVDTTISVSQQGFLSPTTVARNTVSGAVSYGVQVWTRPEGTASPVVRDNAAANTGLEPLAVTSGRLVPSNLTGNTGAASTRRGMVLQGRLVADLTLPFETLPVTIGYDGAWGGLTIGEGVKLTVSAGVVVKSYRGTLAVNGGSLVVNGTAQAPVVFTSVLDDSAGGDYNKDGNVTTPLPGSWYGISSSDGSELPASVSIERASVRYAGASLSSYGDDRDEPNYHPRTTSVTNSSFLHGSSLYVSAAGPVTVTNNTVTNTGSAEQVGNGIDVNQSGYLSATTVSNNTVSGASSYGVSVATRAENVVSPVVKGNAVSNTGLEPIYIRSNRLVPANFTGNTGAASTRRGLLLSGRLVADLTLPFETLPVTVGYDYNYGGLIVGPAAKLTINPGVVVKSYQAGLYVWGGSLVASGTAASPVVFTAVTDDSAGGDYNKDGNVTSPAPGSWYGVTTGEGDNGPSSISLDHVSVRYAPVSVSSSGDDRDDGEYAPRTASITNSAFLHGSSVAMAVSGPAVVANNTITNTGNAELAGNAIDVRQIGYLSPTTVSGNTVSGAQSFGVRVSVRDDAETSPVVKDNAASSTGREPVAVHAMTLIPANLTGNTGAASTRRGLRLSGRLVQSLSLPFGSLPLVLGTPGSDEGWLYVGSGATLSIAAGTIVKSYGGGVYVEDGGTLNATGTSASPVVFTSVQDDQTGGDYNKDGTVTTPSWSDWAGLTAATGGVISITGGRVHYASTALSGGGGEITFRGKLTNNYYGAAASCSPPYFDGAIDVRNVDWGTPTGPWPYGTGDRVNECVMVEPWVGQTVFRARYWGGPYGSAGLAGSAYGSYAYAHRYGGDPVDVATGNLSISATDVTVPEPGPALAFARSYNSQSELSGMLGPKWTTSWDTYLALAADSPLGTYDVHWGDGRIDTFTKRADGSFAATAGNFTQLRAASGSGYVATTKDGVAYAFDAAGALQSVTDRHDNRLTVARDGGGRVSTVADDAGRHLTFAYTSGRLTSVTDPSGAAWTFAYSAAGDLAQVGDPTGATVRYTYNTAHRLLTATDGNGAVVLTNTYDLNGRVAQQVDAGGGTTTFNYNFENARTTKVDPRGGQRTYVFDANGQVTEETDPAGGVTTTTYTAAGLPSKVTDPLGRTTSYTYDSVGNLLTVKDPRGKTTTAAYGALNLPTKVTAADGGVTELAYDATGSLVSTTDPRGNTTTFDVDAHGLRTATHGPDGATTSFAHDARGDLTAVTDPLGGVTHRTFDPAGRMTEERDPLDHATKLTYNSRGDLVTVTDARGKATTTTWDAAGRKTAVTDPAGHTSHWTYTPGGLVATSTDAAGDTTTNTYDLNGNLVETHDPAGRVATASWDLANRRTAQTDPTGAITQYAYDAAGRLTSVTDPLGHVRQRTYDAAGNLTKLTDPLGHPTTFTYDAMGRRTDLTDANGHHWATGYDLAGNRVSERDPLDRTWTFAYDADDHVSQATGPDGKVTKYGYDVAGRLTGKDYSGSPDVVLEYDAAGRLTKRTDGSGTSTFAYDAAGAMTSAQDGLGRTVSYTYDAVGRLSGRTAAGATTTMGYDAAGRLTSATDPAGNATWSYDASGALTGGTLPGGISFTATRDAAQRLTDLTYRRGGTTVFHDTADYDAAGRLTGRTDPTGTHTYTYDAADELLSDQAGSSTTTWSYDNVGNRTSTTAGGVTRAYAYDAADQLATIGGAAVTYDDRGNLTRRPGAGGDITYTYDAADHMTGMTTPAGSWSFLVDDDGTLLRRAGQTTSTYLVDPLEGGLLAQDATRTLTTTAPYATAAAGATRALLGDVTGVVRVAVGASGAGDRVDYDPWGAIASGTGQSGVPSPSGGLIQPDGTIRLGQRVLDPETGRWTSVDPTGLREDDGRLGAYVYARNSPLGFSDPTGTFSLPSLSSVFNAVKSVAAPVLSTGYKLYQGVKDVRREVGHVVNIATSIWDALHDDSGYVSRPTGSPARTLSQDGYGGALFAPANAAYDQARDDLVELGVDQQVQCQVGGYGRIATTAGLGGQFSSSFLSGPPTSAKSGLGVLDKGVSFFTSLYSTGNYITSCGQ